MNSLSKPGNPAWVKGCEAPNPGSISKHIRFKALSYCEKGLEILAKMMEDEGERPDIRLAAIKMILDRGMGLPKVIENDEEKVINNPKTASDEELRRRIAHFEAVEKGLNVIEMKREE